MPGEFQYNYGDCYGNDRFVRMRFALVRALLAPRLKAGIRLLDIGCYDGALLEALKGDLPASAYVGVDADETALAIAG